MVWDPSLGCLCKGGPCVFLSLACFQLLEHCFGKNQVLGSDNYVPDVQDLTVVGRLCEHK